VQVLVHIQYIYGHDLLVLVLAQDPRKFARAKELLLMDEKLKEAKKINFQDEMEGGKEMESMLNI